MNRRLLATVLVCLAVFCTDVPGVSADSPGAEPSAASFSTDGGLTRDSLEEAARHPAPGPARPPAPVPAGPREIAVKPTVRRRTYQPARRAEQSSASSSPLVRRTSHGRNIFVSFIYSWNGWVIHTFHTTTGTVLLGRVGFKG